MTGEQKPGGLGHPTATNTMRSLDALFRIPSSTPAEPAEARIRDLEARIDYLRTSRDGHAAESHKQFLRATAAEANLARAVEGLERIVHWRVEMTGTPVDTEAANAWAMTFDTAATEASQTLAALQQEGG
jgi:hypothetical protein